MSARRIPWVGFGLALALLLLPVAPPGPWAVQPAAAQTASDLEAAVAAGKEAFWNGDFSAAEEAYARAVELAPRNADLWYNRGTAAARAEQPGPAMHAFEQALLLAPGHVDAAHNLGVVRQQVVDAALGGKASDKRSILPGEDDAGTGLLTALSPRSLGILFAIGWILLFAGLHVARRTRKAATRTAAGFAAVVFGLVALGAGGLLYGRQSVVGDRLYGVVASDGPARQGPGERYPVVAAVLPGVKVRLGGEEGAWRQVILPDGGGAWMPAEQVLPLSRP